MYVCIYIYIYIHLQRRLALTAVAASPGARLEARALSDNDDNTLNPKP